MTSSIALVDCNNFFVSCEQLFRPDLKDKPVVVLSSNDGCVIARSNHAKALGIKMGIAWFKVKELAEQHHVTVFSSNFALYSDISNRVMNTLSTFSPVQEFYSIDECFLDLTGFSDIEKRACDIRKTIGKHIGIPVCVGLGPTKTLSKIANYIAKNHPKSQGIFNYNALSESQKQSVLKHVEINEIWGVGRRFSQSLRKLGIKTALELRESNIKMMRAKYGVIMEKMIGELQGINCLELEEADTPNKQITSSQSFGKTTQDIQDLQNAIAHFISHVALKLRTQHSVAGMVQVFIMTDRFRQNQPQHNASLSLPLPVPTNDTLEINRYAMMGLDAIYKAGYRYKKAGVTLSEISDNANCQMNLLASSEHSGLMTLMDTVNTRFGKGALRLSQDHEKRNWTAKREHRSPAYTLSWDEIATCK